MFSDGKEVATFYGGGRTPDEVKRLATEAAEGMNRREDAHSLRDQFAGMAMAAMLRNVTVEGGFVSMAAKAERARRAYEEADAMLAERANQPAQFLGSPNAVKSEIERDLNAVQVNKELLAACEAVLEYLDSKGDGEVVCVHRAALRAAIAQAEGGAS